MTNEEYQEAYRLARENWTANYIKTQEALRDTYINASEQLAKSIKQLEYAGKSQLTIESQAQLERAIRAAADEISDNVERMIPVSTMNSTSVITDINGQYLKDAVRDAGIRSRISYLTINNGMQNINQQVLSTLVNRIWEDGLKFSERVWGEIIQKNIDGLLIDYATGVYSDYQLAIRNLVNVGVSKNRDLFLIAEDLTTYIDKDKVQLMKRWGKLILDKSSKYYSRIPENVDWRAIRLARSELYSAIQETDRLNGINNPAVLSCNWNLTSGAEHSCVCPDLAADSPYKCNNVPDYPHPNCLCYITHNMRSREEFVDDLSRWANGDSVDYLDNSLDNFGNI